MLQSLSNRLVLASMMSVALACAAPQAIAMSVSPMAVEMTSTGTGSTARIEVRNALPQPLPIEVRVSRIDFDENGQVKETPADGEFLIFPPQALVQPNQRQMVRVQWLGGQLPSSRAYYVSISQLPVELDPASIDKTSRSVNVQVVYHMKVLATIAPPGASPKVTVESARPITIRPAPKPGEAAPADSTPQPGVSVTVRNTGKRHAMMAGSNWTIRGTGLDNKPLSVVLDKTRMGQLLGAGYLPAIDGRRTFELPTGTAFSNAPITVKFSD